MGAVFLVAAFIVVAGAGVTSSSTDVNPSNCYDCIFEQRNCDGCLFELVPQGPRRADGGAH
jgi:hypothetical protein